MNTMSPAVDEEFYALVYSDPQWLRAEFDAIIGADSWDSPPPSNPSCHGGAELPARGVGPGQPRVATPRGLGGHTSRGRGARTRSPPGQPRRSDVPCADPPVNPHTWSRPEKRPGPQDPWGHADTRAATGAALAATDDVRLRQILAAYTVIGDPGRRADYDVRNPPPSPPAQTPPVPVLWQPSSRTRPSRTHPTST